MVLKSSQDELKNGTTQGLKDGAWDSKITDCRTENRVTGKNPNNGYNDVGFRIIRIK